MREKYPVTAGTKYFDQSSQSCDAPNSHYRYDQFILEEFPKEAKIVVCQPRRLAATGVANRIAEERGESQPGVESVGYVVRGDTAMCRKSRLVFCTTGVLLRQLQNESALTCLTHIVIDEVRIDRCDVHCFTL